MTGSAMGRPSGTRKLFITQPPGTSVPGSLLFRPFGTGADLDANGGFPRRLCEVPSLRDSEILHYTNPGTSVPGSSLFRPSGTGAGSDANAGFPRRLSEVLCPWTGLPLS